MADGELFDLIVAADPAGFAEARLLFEEYAAQLGVDLCFQNFSAELEQLPAIYGPPTGQLILARHAGRPAGCVGVRALPGDGGVCEMKRLYVRDEARGHGLGRRLASAGLAAARTLGYKRMVLDTLGTMTAARALYATLGFRETAGYYPNPHPAVTYLEVAL